MLNLLSSYDLTYVCEYDAICTRHGIRGPWILGCYKVQLEYVSQPDIWDHDVQVLGIHKY